MKSQYTRTSWFPEVLLPDESVTVSDRDSSLNASPNVPVLRGIEKMKRLNPTLTKLMDFCAREGRVAPLGSPAQQPNVSLALVQPQRSRELTSRDHYFKQKSLGFYEFELADSSNV